MHDLLGELSTRSEDFRRRWSSHDVRLHGAGTTVEPGSRTAQALALLASWAATELHPHSGAADDAAAPPDGLPQA